MNLRCKSTARAVAALAACAALSGSAAPSGPAVAGQAVAGPAVAGQVAAGQAVAGSAVSPACPTTLNVVAHQDDDLLFINPDVSDDITAGRCVVTVFATAGDAGRPSTYWHGREAGAMAAYAAMAGVEDRWTAGTLTVADHTVTTMSLDGAPVLLVFLRLPDGHGYAVTGYESLQRLWTGSLPSIHAVDTGAAYTRESLIGVLTAVMAAYRPGVVRTLNFAGPYGDGDHGDHHTVGYLTRAAFERSGIPRRLSAYLGYQLSGRPDNLTDGDGGTKLDVFLAYAPHDPHVCPTRSACLGDRYAPWFRRRYLVARQDQPVRAGRTASRS